ncbi:MAG: exodeoxyribonuclease VII large subunit [Chitinophagaceae bacterium]|nr:MAG: exodeoxyribonuclease VII large subunit [Chitinophagaceae bacterium]
MEAKNSEIEKQTTGAQGTRTFRLSELTGSIERMFARFYSEKTFPVIAEVVDHKFYASKQHHYLALVEKDEQCGNIIAKVSARAWRTGAASIREFERITGQRFSDNIKVLLTVAVAYHSVHGLTLIIKSISPEFTIGALQQQRLLTIERLLTECSAYIRRDGEQLITRNKELPEERVLQRLALITSSSSAGYQDFQHTFDTNKFGYRFQIDNYFTPVQGATNAEEICKQLNAIGTSQKAYDAVILIRGGGAATDFLVFDDFEVCRRIAKLPFPVITGIGHQKDETICDLVAKWPTKTPTKVAEFLIAHNRHFEDALLQFQKNLVIKAQQLLANNDRSLAAIKATVVNKSRDLLIRHDQDLMRSRQVVLNNSRELLLRRRTALGELSAVITSIPVTRIRNAGNDLKNLQTNLTSFTRKYLVNQRGYLGHFQSLCRLRHPNNLLNKGFALVYHQNKLAADTDGVPTPGAITIRMRDGSIEAQTLSKTKTDGQ